MIDIVCSAEVARNLIENSDLIDMFAIQKVDKPLTVLDIAKARGVVDSGTGITMGQVEDVGLPFMGGCEICEATIGCFNAYPSKSGYLRCEDHIDNDSGFKTAEEFNQFENDLF